MPWYSAGFGVSLRMALCRLAYAPIGPLIGAAWKTNLRLYQPCVGTKYKYKIPSIYVIVCISFSLLGAFNEVFIASSIKYHVKIFNVIFRKHSRTYISFYEHKHY